MTPSRLRYPPLRLTALLALAVIIPALSVGADPAQEYRTSIETVRHVLAPYRTEMDMIEFIGDIPFWCTDGPGGTTICSWRLSKREKGWRPLAKALDTGDRLNLVCEFPANDAPRATDSCSVHSQRSNRGYWRARMSGADGGGGGRNLGGSRRELQAQAKKLLAGARTAFELSTLVGDAPAQCRVKKRRAFCVWRTDADTYGHGTLAVIIDTGFGDKVRLACMLPADGSPREPESCTAKPSG